MIVEGHSRLLAVQGFWAIWRGESPLITDLLDRDATRAVLPGMLEGERLELDDGRLRGIHGLTLEITPHCITHQGGAVNTWCALDAVAIPAALEIDAEASTLCPACGRLLHVRIRGGVTDADAALRLWLPQGPCNQLRTDFCQHARLYCDLGHLERHRPPGRGRVVTVPEVAALGPDMWSDVRGGGDDSSPRK